MKTPSTSKQLFCFAEPQVATSFDKGGTHVCVGTGCIVTDGEKSGAFGDGYAESNLISAKKGAVGHPRCSPLPDSHLYNVHKTVESCNRVNRQVKTAAPPRVALD